MKPLRSILAVLALAMSGAAFAEYPDKPVTIVVPFAGGGPTDKVARDLAEAMRKPLGGQSIIIENAAGAGGTMPTRARSTSPTPASARPRTCAACCSRARSRSR